MQAIRRITTYVAAIAVVLAATMVALPGPTRAAEGRDGSLILSADLELTTTPAGDPGALRLSLANQSLRNLVDGCARNYSCERNGLRSGSMSIAEMTTVIPSGATEPVEIAAGTDLPVGFQFAGRGGRAGDPGANPVNLSGAPDLGTETIRMCYDGIFISGIASTCKWAREFRSGDTGFWGAGPPAHCPSYTNGEAPAYGANSGDGPPHVALITNDAGPVNRNWGPIPGGGNHPDGYNHPNGQLWDQRRQKWAHARWSILTCAGISIGGIGGSVAITKYRSLFIYKDEPAPGAWTLSMMDSTDERNGSRSNADENPDAWATCSPISTSPPNPCRVTYELALSLDLTASGHHLMKWSSCGDQSVSHSASDKVTWPGHATAVATTVLRTPCKVSGSTVGASNSRVTAFRTADGTMAATGFSNADGDWSLDLPPASCEAGGYKILAGAPVGMQPRWYPGAGNYSAAACVPSPASGVTMSLPNAAPVSGTISTSSGGSIGGAVIYAFDASNGTFAGYAVSRSDDGQFEIPLTSGVAYKLKILPPSGHSLAWHGDRAGLGFASATSVLAPGIADTSLLPSGYVAGYVKDTASAADLAQVAIHAWRASDGTYAGSAVSDATGRYLLTAESAGSYKLLVRAGQSHEDIWSDGAAGYVEATPVVSPGTANFSLRRAAMITGYAPGSYVSAYTTCGCTTPANAVADGHYAIKVVSTEASGWAYKVRFITPGMPVSWYSGKAGFGDAIAVQAPAGNVDR